VRVVLVGACGSGKTTLAQGLVPLGYEVRECRQEHSGVPHMWQVISRPDVLIYLDASEDVVERRGRRQYVPGLYEDQRRRLAHARAHCDLYVMTDDLTPSQVLERVTDFLSQRSRARLDLTDAQG
jgi:shikimate kinase